MEREEFKILVKAMKATYPDPKFIPDKDAFDVWFDFLKDMDYKTLSNALGRHICTSKFPPTIADLREQALKNNTDAMNGEQAWALVFKAVENSNYNSQEEFDKLPPIVQKSIGSPANLRELALMPTETVNSVEKSHFLRTYDAEVRREREFNQMPESVRNLIANNQPKGIEG